MRSPRPPAGTGDRAAPQPLDDAIPARATLADRACCCPARAMVRVIMPATAARPQKTELLLCGHHYRLSRHVLAQAKAVVDELPGLSGDTAAWIRSGLQECPAPVS